MILPTESTWCKVEHTEQTFLLGCIYRPPINQSNQITPDLDESLVAMLDNVLMKYNKFPIIICGDFNYPAIHWSDNNFPSNLDRFRRLVEFYSLTQHVSEPTRENATLDLILTNQSNLIKSVVHLEPFLNSDHDMLEAEIILPIRIEQTRDPSVRSFRDYRSVDWLDFTAALSTLNWQKFSSSDNVNECWSELKANLVESLNIFAPLTCCIGTNRRIRKRPWFNRELRLLRAKKRNAWKAYQHCRTQPNLLAYRQMRNNLTSAMRNARAHYEEGMAEKLSTNPQLFFQYANFKARNQQQFPRLVTSDGTSTQNQLEAANELNTYFVTVFNQANTIIPCSALDNETNNSATMYSFDLQTVRLRLLRLNVGKAAGPDDISNNVLKQTSYFLAPRLTTLFQLSLNQGIVPDDWKDAHVTPIHKSGRLDLANNYRPISLTSCVCKIMERFIYDWLYEYLCRNSPLHSSQHGFQQSQSCTTQLLEYFHDVTLSLDNHMCVDVIYLDFSKAFDKITHSLLLEKLYSRNVPRKLIAWIASFLHNRRQRVVLGTSYSEWAPVTSGVPQGSVLGPLLFNLFIDDLDDALHPDVTIKKFADDTKLYIVYSRDVSALAAQKMQTSLNAVMAWCDRWLMQLNITKCTSMYFGVNNSCTPYSLNDTVLTATLMTRDLGVIVSNCARVSQQCSNVATKARRTSGFMLRTFTSRQSKVIVPMLKAIIRPIMEYATPVWNPCLQKDIKEIEQVQRKVTKCIIGLKHVPYAERLRQLDLPTLQTRRLYFDMLECFKIVHGLVRSECSNSIALSERNTRGYHCKLTSSLPPARLNVRKHFFLERVLSHWNALPVEIIRQENYTDFKQLLRKHLSV